jgi:hypothetical protein
MKKFKKIIIISFLWLFIITIFGLASVDAQGILSERNITFKPQVAIPGFGERTFGETGSTRYIAEYIVAIYRYGISIGAILATVVLMAAGLIWLASGGSQEKIGQAKNMISGSIIGLVLLFGSYTLLNTINPELVNFHIQDIDFAPEIKYVCCTYKKENGGTGAKMTTSAECSQLNNSFSYGENYTTNPNRMFGPNQGCHEINSCCTFSVYYDFFGDNYGGYFNLKFPISSSSLCYLGDKKYFNHYRTIGKITSGACEYENTSNCFGKNDGTLCYNASRSSWAGQSIDCETEGVCGWCFDGTCVNTFAKNNQPCGGYMTGKCQSSCLGDQIEFISGRKCEGDLKCCYPVN